VSSPPGSTVRDSNVYVVSCCYSETLCVCPGTLQIRYSLGGLAEPYTIDLDHRNLANGQPHSVNITRDLREIRLQVSFLPQHQCYCNHRTPRFRSNESHCTQAVGRGPLVGRSGTTGRRRKCRKTFIENFTYELLIRTRT